MTNVAIFVSGNGTNCVNIIRYFQSSEDVCIRLVVSNRANAYALVRAKGLKVPTQVVSKTEFAREEIVMPLLQEYNIQFIVLAGFLLMIPDFLIRAYEQRIINIHPALLPKHGGKGMWGHHVHEAVKAAGDKESGMTVHYVTNECDGGQIIAQFSFPVAPDDTPDDIAQKEHTLEMTHFPQVIEQVIKNTFPQE